VRVPAHDGRGLVWSAPLRAHVGSGRPAAFALRARCRGPTPRPDPGAIQAREF